MWEREGLKAVSGNEVVGDTKWNGRWHVVREGKHRQHVVGAKAALVGTSEPTLGIEVFFNRRQERAQELNLQHNMHYG